DQVLLVPEVAVQGHGGHTELRSQPPQGDRLEALRRPDLERSLDDAGARQASAVCRNIGTAHRRFHDLTSIRCIRRLLLMSTPYTDIDNVVASTHADPPPRAPMAAVLGSRPYQLLWGAQFASLVAGFFNYVAVAWLALQLTGSSLAVGSVLAAASIPMAVLMLVGGAASDRFSARATMLGAGLVRG